MRYIIAGAFTIVLSFIWYSMPRLYRAIIGGQDIISELIISELAVKFGKLRKNVPLTNI